MKQILAALDSSPNASVVLREAIDLAQRTGASVTLYRAISIPTELPPEAFSSRPDQIEGMLVAAALRDLDAMAAQVPKEIKHSVTVELGVPWQSILHAARHANADLIVVGARGHGLLERVLGTTASRVINHADRSVLVVHVPQHPQHHA